MTSKSAPAGPFSLRRWSQRKLEAARTEAQSTPQAPASVASVALPAAEAQGAPRPPDAVAPDDTPLPPIESLTIDSDFAPFFRPQVDELIKRAALKQLFRDPRFNVMDGLDTYIDDYTQPDPIPSAMLADLMQRRVSFNIPGAETDPARVVNDSAGHSVASAAGAVASPDAQIEPLAQIEPVAAADAVTEKTLGPAAESAPNTDVHDKIGKT